MVVLAKAKLHDHRAVDYDSIRPSVIVRSPKREVNKAVVQRSLDRPLACNGHGNFLAKTDPKRGLSQTARGAGVTVRRHEYLYPKEMPFVVSTEEWYYSETCQQWPKHDNSRSEKLTLQFLQCPQQNGRCQQVIVTQSL